MLNGEQSRTMTIGQYQEALAYWRGRLGESGGMSFFPPDKPAARTLPVRDASVRERFPAELSDKLAAVSGGSPVGLYLILLAGVLRLLSLYSGERDVTAGMGALRRTAGGGNRLLPLRAAAGGELSLKGMLAQLKWAATEADRHSGLSADDFRRLLGGTAPEEAGHSFRTAVLLDGIHPDTAEGAEDIAAETVFYFRSAEPGLSLEISYSSQVYRQETMERVARLLLAWFAAAIEHPDVPCAELELLTGEERDLIVRRFNRAAEPYPREASAVQLFEEQAALGPDRLAVADGAVRWTYRELNGRANALARRLRDCGVRPEEPVGLLEGRSPLQIAAVLGILKAGGAYVPLDPDYPEERLGYMLDDCGARVLLAGPEERPPASFGGTVLRLEEGLRADSADEPDPEPAASGPERLAYIMYTSGTTGRPKGVMVEHRNIVRLVKNNGYVPFGPDARFAQTGAVGFDAGTFELFGPLLNGGSVHPVAKDVLLDAGKLERFLSGQGVTTMWLTSPLFNRLAEDRPRLFAPLEHLIVGGDALSAGHIRAVREACAGLQLWNGYGPTENTTFSTCFRIDRDFEDAIPIGRPIGHSTAYVVGPEGRLQPIGVPGELWVGGDGVARGYLNAPELTAEKFVPDPFAPGGRLYRTGDRASWLPDGTLAYLGRMDRQAKIRGHRIEPGEVEAALGRIAPVREAVVVVREDEGGEKELWGYYTGEGLTEREARSELAGMLPGHMVPAQLIRLERMPLTPNGKIDLAALPAERAEAAGAPYAAPRTETEAELVRIWQDLLGAERIGIHDSFFDRGGHSLKATRLISKIHERFQADISLKRFFAGPTVAELAAAIAEAGPSAFVSLSPAEKREWYPLSSAQKRMFVLDRLEGSGQSYNIPAVMIVEGALDRERFDAAFRALIVRHEALRTSFRTVDGEPVQLVHETFEFEIEYAEGSEDGLEGLIGKLNRPFDIGLPCLPKVALVRLADDRHLFFLNIHHIVADGTSMGILVKEFTELYEGRDLPPLKLQYKDFAVWQNGSQGSEAFRTHEAYWLGKVTGDWPVLAFPADRPRPAVQSFAGDTLLFELPGESARRVRKIAAEEGTTLYTVLLAAFKQLLSRYSGQDDIVVGTGVAGRTHADLEGMLGMFVNMLALRSRPSGDKSFRRYVSEVKEISLEAFEHQDYPFEALAEQCGIERDPGRNPLFDIAFVVQNMDLPDPDVDGLRFRPVAYDSRTSKFDLTLFVWERGERVLFQLEYGTSLFDRATMERLSRHFLRLLDAAAAAPDERMSDFDMLTEEEKTILLRDFNRAASDFPADRTIHSLFEAQADLTPDRNAIRSGAESYTYRQLDEEANRIAGFLLERSESWTDRPVAILLEPSILRASAVLGVLKAGAAYVPIDPETPQERIKAILEDAEIAVALSGKRHLSVLNRLQWECPAFTAYVCLDSDEVYGEEESRGELMDDKLWEYVGRQATDDITGGGWVSSYTREPLSREEMDEYGDNALLKLKPYLHKEMRVLEIGCASGITMFRIAPHVGYYCGTDLSSVIIEKGREKAEAEQRTNIRLECLPADRIDELDETEDFDLVIVNSVIQVFPGYNYLRRVLAKAASLLKEQGLLFIGDVMDQEKKEQLLQSLRDYKREHPEAKTKLDFRSELFVPKAFFEDLAVDMPEVREARFSGKIHTIENELTEFRYDVLLEIDKRPRIGPEAEAPRSKRKEQLGRGALKSRSAARASVPGSSSNLAYIIYTSGTTGKPKGVMIEHRSLVNLAMWHIRSYGLTDRDRCTLYAGFGFDASVWEFFPPLLVGASLHVVPEETRLDLHGLRTFFEREAITAGFLPTQLCEPFMETEPPSALRLLLTGGDRLKQARTLPYEVYNNYGPTENTVVTAYYRLVQPEQPIPIGRPVANTRLFVLDEAGRLQPVGVPGELCIAGEGLARGYWNEPELTAAKFVPNPFRPGERMYWTGDSVRWRADGNLEYLGRIDHQVKIRGYRVELAEIETRIRQIAGIRDAVVLARENAAGGSELCAYFTASQTIAEAEMRESLAASLPAYMIPAQWIPLEVLPLTPNGKVDRKALLKRSERKRTAELAPPRTEMEARLAGLWREVLGGEQPGIRDNFFELGGDSIKAIQISAKLHKERLKLEVRDLFRYPTIEELALRVVPADAAYPQEPVEGETGLTPIQRWFFDRRFDESHHWNQSFMLRLPGRLDPEAVKSAWTQLASHHDALRMVFETDGGQSVVQRNRSLSEAGSGVFRFKEIDLRGERQPERRIEEEAGRLQAGLDLERGPLVALGLFQADDGDHLLIVIHHLVVDGVSWRILFEDFNEAYRKALQGETAVLPEKTMSFQAWSERLGTFAESRTLLREIPYWKREEREGALLPPLLPDSVVQDRRMEASASFTVAFTLEETAKVVKDAHRAYSTEINDLLLTALALSMRERTGGRGVAIELEGHGREPLGDGLAVTRTVGWFTSMYPVVLSLEPDGDYGSHLKAVKEKLRRVPRKGIGYGILKYLTPSSLREELAFELRPDIGFNYLGDIGSPPGADGLGGSPYAGHSGSQLSPRSGMLHRLAVNGLMADGRLQFTWTYHGGEFEPDSIERLGLRFREELLALAEHCIGRPARERTPSDLGCADLSVRELDEWNRELPGLEPGAELLRVYPLSPLQEGLLFHALLEPSSPAYFEQLTLTFDGKLDLARFAESFDRLVRRHDILRTVFRRSREGKALQAVLSRRSVKVHAEDLRGMSAELQERRIETFRRDDRQAGFDVSRDPLMRFAVFRTGEAEHRVVWSHHHILMDGWCVGILLREFDEAYRSLLRGSEPRLPEAQPYGEFIAWHERQDKEEAGAFWERYLSGYEQLAVVPALEADKEAEPASAEPGAYGTHEFAVPARTAELLEGAAKRYRTTVSTVLQAAWSILLAKYNHATDVAFGTVVSGRPADIAGIETMVGLFINTIPVRVAIDPAGTFAELLQDMQRRALNAAAYDWYPLAEMKSAWRSVPFQHLFVYENYPVERRVSGAGGQDESSLMLREVELFEQTNYDFTLVAMPGEELRIKLSYSASVYGRAGMERVGRHLLRVLEGALAEPEGRLDRVAMLEDEEREAALAFNATEAAYPREETLDGLFAAQAAKAPERVAMVAGGETLTYGELAAEAARYAAALAAQGVKRGDRVGLIVRRGFATAIGMLAILKTGAAYVPIEPDYPAERQRSLLDHAEAAAVLTDAEPAFEAGERPVLRLDLEPAASGGTIGATRGAAASVVASAAVSAERIGAAESAAAGSAACAETSVAAAWRDPERSSSDLAYIIYTSGSTGTPKGVMMEHRSAVNLIHWVNGTYGVGETDRLLWVTSMCFDLSVYDLFGLWAAGGTVVTAEKEQVQDPRRLWRLLEEEGITFWDSVPTTLNYFVQSLEEQAWSGRQSMLRLAFLSGDWIPVGLKDRLRRYFPEAQVIGLGGATEAAVWSNYYPIERVEEGQRSIPYGKPLANNEFYILDPFGEPVPAGVAGELHIGGAGVARGYLNDELRTKEAFVASPFRPGERMYRTGDLGRLLPDGNMEFLGRKDHQVKIRGYRIELGEVESRLAEHPEVREAVAIARGTGDPQLCAYVVAEPGSEVTAEELKAHLAKKLPSYMLPSHIARLPELPLSANGKIDRKALPAPEGLLERGEKEAPRTETERALAGIWRELLGVGEVGRNEDFFALGGHSLLAATMAARVASELGVELPLPLAFRYPTIRELAEKLETLRLFRGEPERPVTRLNDGGEGSRIIFCFPPVAGYGFEYKGLADALPSYTWYAFDFREPSGGIGLASEYADLIRELQPDGPYTLLGYSAGGNLAFEAAKALEEEGCPVSELILLDAERKAERIATDEERLERETDHALTVAEARYGELLRVPAIRQEAAARMNGYRRYLNDLVNDGSVHAGMHVVLAENSETFRSWDGSTAKGAKAHHGAGGHMDMLDGDRLIFNARLLRAILTPESGESSRG